MNSRLVCTDARTVWMHCPEHFAGQQREDELHRDVMVPSAHGRADRRIAETCAPHTRQQLHRSLLPLPFVLSLFRSSYRGLACSRAFRVSTVGRRERE